MCFEIPVKDCNGNVFVYKIKILTLTYEDILNSVLTFYKL